MNNQEMVEYLKQYKTVDKHIDRLIEEKQRWFDRATKVTPTWSDMPKGSDGENPRELAICKMMDCETEIKSMIDDFVDLGNEIKGIINELEDSRLRLIMNYKYIDGKTHEEIAEKLDISVYWLGELHAKAMEKILVHKKTV